MKGCLLAIFLAAGFAAFCCHYVPQNLHQEKHMQKSIVIVLNGPSSAGKSSIQTAFLGLASELYLKVGIDGFFYHVLPEVDPAIFIRAKTFKTEKNGELVRKGERTVDVQGNPILQLEVGPAGQRVIHGMHKAFLAYADVGNNLIVDYIAYQKDWLSDLKEVLNNHRVIFVGVKTPLSVLEEREAGRGAYPSGHARSHYDQVHDGWDYDLEVDTSKMSSEQCAAKILDFVKK